MEKTNRICRVGIISDAKIDEKTFKLIEHIAQHEFAIYKEDQIFIGTDQWLPNIEVMTDLASSAYYFIVIDNAIYPKSWAQDNMMFHLSTVTGVSRNICNFNQWTKLKMMMQAIRVD
jgi:hypothetical protein